MDHLGVEKMSGGLTEEQRQAFERAGFTVYSPRRQFEVDEWNADTVQLLELYLETLKQPPFPEVPWDD